ncbi:MAG: UvrD-helicase domain-containing protein, partial [Planctomycetota bacterium]|nr:UvrD-helicase domain-containing protein [Planctomycetota bacterium]
MDSAKLLRDSPSYAEVREYFRERFTHILVDEFQDTDPIQAEVMFLVTAEDPAETDWKRAAPRPGSLFVVGDPKQSIYRFRRADISVYDLVKEKFAGNVLTLTATFRIAEGLCERLNPALRALIEKHKTPYQATYTDLDPVRPAAVKDPIRHLYHETVKGNIPAHTKNYRVALKDAEAISRIISDMKDWSLSLFVDQLEGDFCTRRRSGVRWGDFLILTRQKSHLPIYASALEKLGIPYRVSGANAFKGREISPFMNLLIAVADPENSVALVAYLRDALAGISDETLYQFKSAGGSFESLWQLLRKSEELSPEIHSSALHLKAGTDFVRRCLPSVAVERILEESGLLALTRSQESGGSRAGSLLKVVSLARRMEREGLSFVEIVARLEGIHESKTSADYSESLSLHPAQEDAVTLMNLHKAKGLEAPVVFLADPRTLSWHAPRLHVRRTGG